MSSALDKGNAAVDKNKLGQFRECCQKEERTTGAAKLQMHMTLRYELQILLPNMGMDLRRSKLQVHVALLQWGAC